MKIKYTFATGENTEVDVNDEIGTIILDSRRQENNLDRKERYHCFSMESIAKFDDCDDRYPRNETTPLDELLSAEFNSHLNEALEQLSVKQKERLLLLANGYSIREIARRENKDHKTILESIEAARKKIKKFL